VVGESKRVDLSDIDLQCLETVKDFPNESKKLCFLRQAINEIEYTIGAHSCFPQGNIQYSLKTYINKHMHFLGLEFLKNKYTLCYHRSNNMRKQGLAVHYTDDLDNITSQYNDVNKDTCRITSLPNTNWSYYKGLDSGGSDIKCVGKLPIDLLIKNAECTPGCSAFNTLGYLKSGYSLKLESTQWIHPFSDDGIYIRNTNNNVFNKFSFFDENNIRIDNEIVENIEQLQANTFIKPDAVVLELGARYGSVSCVINSKLNNPNNQVSVEPDSRVWNALEMNMVKNGCKFNILKGVISNIPLELTNLSNHYGYGTTSVKTESSSTPNYTLNQVEDLYSLKFDTLVADCEGFLESFLDDNPRLYNQLSLIMFEKDYPDKCNYGKITKELENHGFKNMISGFHEVWSKA
jgi:FkbM family methyltransferase